jgi:hypothetical protein
MALSPEVQIFRAKIMGTFLDSDTWQEVVERIEGECVKGFKAKDMTPEKLLALWQRWQSFEDVQRVFRAIRDRGQLAENPEE